MDLIPEVKTGYILAVSAPSGTGKTSLCDKLAEELPYVRRSISVTTRKARDGEVSGKDYTFVSLEEFNKLKEAGEFIETAEVFGNWYGTLKSPVQEAIKNGKVMVMDIDTVGALEVKQQFGSDCVSLFIVPPSLDELQSRLKGRGKDSEGDLQKRLKEASRELSESHKYEYVIANKMFDDAYIRLKSIVIAERSSIKRLVLKTAK